MKKVYRVINVLSFIALPFIMIQWNILFYMFSYDELRIFRFLYLISIAYVPAYIYIMQYNKKGYYMMWLINIVLVLAYLWLSKCYLPYISIMPDLWFSVIFTICFIIMRKQLI